MVVVLPAPFGPSRPKHSPARDLEIEAVDGDDVAVALDEPRAARGERRVTAGHRVDRVAGASGGAASRRQPAQPAGEARVLANDRVRARSEPVETIAAGTPDTSRGTRGSGARSPADRRTGEHPSVGVSQPGSVS